MNGRARQAPVGWWQDAKGRMQPPGSFLAPALRHPSEGRAGANPGPEADTSATPARPPSRAQLFRDGPGRRGERAS
jgi:hypothetical protein